MKSIIRFGKLIEVKENLLSEKKKELQKTINSFEMISAQIISIDGDIRKNYVRLSLNILDSNEVFVLREHIVSLEEKKSLLLKEKNRLSEKIDHLKTELTEILKEIKTLETLKSKALYNIKKAISKKEQKKLDELALRLNIKTSQK
ncbi:MAG: hypothetical protein N2596_02585 [Syntrophorhabdaceae bacterium]|nr:hypothetical protein [Syntrophorhabdaceae bacterium]